MHEAQTLGEDQQVLICIQDMPVKGAVACCTCTIAQPLEQSAAGADEFPSAGRQRRQRQFAVVIVSRSWE